jgi:hypothetical protein
LSIIAVILVQFKTTKEMAMKIFSPRVHGYLDYFVVIAFLFAPMLFNFSGIPAKISYAIAGVHLLVTISTDFPLGLIKVISFKLHSTIEFIVPFILIVLPWLLGFASISSARNFYLAAGITIFIVWLITDYKIAR